MRKDRVDLERHIKTLSTGGAPDVLYWDSKRSNLYVRVLLSGRKTFQLRKRHEGAMRVPADLAELAAPAWRRPACERGPAYGMSTTRSSTA